MRSHAHHPAKLLPSVSRRSRGFTLIEVLIVVAIIVTLAGISVFVGGAVKRQSSKRSTQATLHTLQALMDEYLKAGNPEPIANDTVPAGSPKSDTTNYVRALRAVAGAGAKLQSLQFGEDTTKTPTVPQAYILDAFGSPIRFVPSSDPNNPTHRFYFFSAGPDGVAYNTAPPPPDFMADNFTSLDN